MSNETKQALKARIAELENRVENLTSSVAVLKEVARVCSQSMVKYGASYRKEEERADALEKELAMYRKLHKPAAVIHFKVLPGGLNHGN